MKQRGGRPLWGVPFLLPFPHLFSPVFLTRLSPRLFHPPLPPFSQVISADILWNSDPCGAEGKTIVETKDLSPFCRYVLCVYCVLWALCT